MGVGMHEAGLFGLVIYDGREDAVGLDVFHHGPDHLGGEQEVLFAEEVGFPMDALEFRHQHGVGAEPPDVLLDYRLVACDNDDVGFFGSAVEAHVREHHVQCLQDVQEQLVVEFVGLDPLDPKSAGFHVAAHLGVELVTEKARHAADPGVAGHADQQVVLAAVGQEKRLGVVDVNVDAGVVVAAGVPGVEPAGKIHHLVLDFHAVKILQQRVGQQVMGAHAGAKSHHARVVGLGAHRHGHERRSRLGQFVTFDGVLAVLAHAGVGLAIGLDIPMHIGFVETDGGRLSVLHHNLFVGMQVLVGTERTGGHQVRVKIHEDGRQNHQGRHQVERHAVAEPFTIDHQQHKADGKVQHGSKNQGALQLQERQENQAATCRTDNGAHRVPAVNLADGSLALEGTGKNHRDERERHARKETGRHHPQHRQGVLEKAPTDIAVGGGIENLVRLVHHAPEGLVEVQRTQGKEGHKNLSQRKDHQGVLLQKLAANGASDGKSQNESREHLVETVAGTAHQEAQQAYPDNLVNKRGKPRNGRNPEPGVLGRHGQLVFGNVIDVQRLGGTI